MKRIIQPRFNSIAALYIFQRHGEHAREKRCKGQGVWWRDSSFLTLPVQSWSSCLLPSYPKLLLALYNAFKSPENAQTLLFAFSSIPNTLGAQ